MSGDLLSFLVGAAGSAAIAVLVVIALRRVLAARRPAPERPYPIDGSHAAPESRRMLDRTVTSEPTLAPERDPQPDASAAAPAASGPSATRILVVDDQDAVRRLTTRLLTRNGYDVEEAPDGATALQRCADAGGPPDLLLTDLVLPGMTGTELRDRVHRVVPDLPVLFMTGFTGPVQERYGLREGIDSVISKPFNAGELLDAVSAALPRPQA